MTKMMNRTHDPDARPAAMDTLADSHRSVQSHPIDGEAQGARWRRLVLLCGCTCFLGRTARVFLERSVGPRRGQSERARIESVRAGRAHLERAVLPRSPAQLC